MKSPILTLTLVAGLLYASSGFAQTPAPAAPAAATAAKAPASVPAAAPASATAATTAQAPSPAVSTTPPGGGHGQVWVNTKSHVYHCEGSKSYGKTKSGEYMTESEAKTKGNHADHGKACAK